MTISIKNSMVFVNNMIMPIVMYVKPQKVESSIEDEVEISNRTIAMEVSHLQVLHESLGCAKKLH